MANKSGVPGSLRRKIFKKYNYTCQECGLVGYEKKHVSKRGIIYFTYPTDIDDVYLSIDHIIPKSISNNHSEENLRVLCVPCNNKKGVTNGPLP